MRVFLVGLTFVCLVFAPSSLAAAGDAYIVEDPSADVAAGAAGTRQPVPSVDTMPYIDLTKLEIRDVDEELLEFHLSNAAGFRSAPTDVSTSVYIGLQQTRHRVHFTVAGIGTPPAKVFLETEQLRWRVENDTDAKTEVVTTGTSLCVPLPGSLDCDFFSQFYVEHRIEEGVLVFLVPKELLTSQAAEVRSSFGAAGGANALPPRLFAGDRLTEIYVLGEEPNQVFASGLGMPTLEVQDRLPNQGHAPDFVLTYPSATNDLVIHYPTWSVVAGEENLVSVQIDNKAPVKRIVNFTVEQDPRAGDAWPITVTPTVTVAAGQSTNITMRVKAPPLKDGLGDHAIVKLRGNVITQPGNVAIRTAYLVSTVALDKEHSKFFFFGDTFNSLPVLPTFGFGQLSRLEAEASRSSTPIPFYSYSGIGLNGASQLFQHAWDVGGVPNAAKVRPGESGKAQFEIESPAAFDASLSLQMMQQDLPVAQHVGDVSIGQGRTTIEVPLTLLPDVTSLSPANGTFFVMIELTGTGPESAPIGFAHLAGQEISLVPKETWFELPLERDFSVAPVAAPFKVSLAAAEDLQSFVNPGRTQVFEFDLRNEEEKAVRLELVADNKSADWPVEIRPGVRYRLDGNDSAHLGVLVTAPASAKEGEQFTMQLLARESDSQLPVALARIHIVVTSGVEIEDETFAAAQEDASKVDAESKKSPDVAIVPVLLAVAFIVWRRRRADQ